MKKVAIVVLNYKTFGETIECLDSLAKVTYPNVEVIVVDNASGNDSLGHVAEALNAKGVSFVRADSSQMDAVAKFAQPIILFQTPDNRGYAAGNNWGIRIALSRGAAFVLILNNDTIVEPGFLEPLVNMMESDVRIGVVGPKIVGMNGKVDRVCARGRMSYWGYCDWLRTILKCFMRPQEIDEYFGYYYKGYQFDEPKCVNKLSGACFLISRQALESVGLLDETTFLMYEESILAEKLASDGYLSCVVPKSCILHKGSGTISKEPSRFIASMIRKSRDYYYRHYRHWNWFQRFFLVLDIPRWNVLRRIGKMVTRK